MTKPKLSSDERRLAAIDMIRYYFCARYTDWRYIKLLSIKKQLDTKYEFYNDIVPITETTEKEACIAQEIKNGLYFEAIAECVQYIEDLFALIKASMLTEYFVKNIVTYDAGQIRSFIKKFTISDENLGKCFHFKHDLKFSDGDNADSYKDGIVKLRYLLELIKRFFDEYEFFYNQYKHGLTLPMRPFGNHFTPDQVAKERAGELVPFIVAFDNFNLDVASKKGTFAAQHPVMMPGFTENVSRNISKLHNENNYLRLVFPSDQYLTIDKFVEMAKQIRLCMNIFVYNYDSELTGHKKFQLPKDTARNIVITCDYSDE